MKLYLLSVKELQDGIVTTERCLEKLDSHRRKKAEQLKAPDAKALSIGAGLLLQLVWAEREEGHWGKVGIPRDGFSAKEQSVEAETPLMEQFSVTQLLDRLDGAHAPQELLYGYDAKGKPQFADNLGGTIGFPCFNLSHSGEYVCCAAGIEEVGIDIQQMRPLKNFRVAERYFSEREQETLAACQDWQEREKIFYEIWVQKEAYAKLTGEGIGTGIAVDTFQTQDVAPQEVEWQLLPAPEGYCMAICRYNK